MNKSGVGGDAAPQAVNANKTMSAKKYLLLLIPVVMITAGQTLSKVGAQQLSRDGRILNIFIICGYCLLVLRGLVWIVILRNIKLSTAYPAISITYVLILAISYYFFREPLAPQKIAGAFLIISGVFCIGVGEFGSKGSKK